MSDPGQDRPAMSRRAVVRTAGLGALAAGLGMAATGAPADAQSFAASGIVGTWRVRVTIGDQPRGNDLEFLLAFFPGGVFLGLDPPVEPASRRIAGTEPLDYQAPPGGQWLQLPSGEVRATLLQLNYSSRAQVTHEERTNYRLTYDGATDTINGSAEWRELSRDGRVLFSFTSGVSGTRVAVEA